jgi:hypothetical protein
LRSGTNAVSAILGSARDRASTTASEHTLVAEASALFVAGRAQSAIALLERANKQNPDRPRLLAEIASIHERTHNFDAARDNLKRAFEIDPACAAARLVTSRIAIVEGRPVEALETLDAIGPGTIPAHEQTQWHQLRGRALEALKRYSEAFDAYARARRMDALVRGVKPGPMDASLVPSTTERWFAGRVARNDNLPHPTRLTTSSPTPVFVFGFPRSGTTLVEQILTSHPAIVGLGEANLTVATREAFEAAAGGPFPQILDSIGHAQAGRLLTRARSVYLETISQQPDFDENARWFVDKTPLNGMEYSFLRLIFPEAAAIHVVRHPLDSVLSTYFETFHEPPEWSYSLIQACRLYARLYRHVDIMTSLLPSNFMTVRYERIVEDLETNARSLLNFVGAPWDPTCLEFHRNRRLVRTASYAQVTRPIYRSSMFRYRSFLDSIDPKAVDVLRPVIAELGYRIEKSHTGEYSTAIGNAP